MSENRFFNSLPPRFQTAFNKKQAMLEDSLLEPSDFKHCEGQIGDDTSVTDREKLRVPFINQYDSARQKTQLSTAAVSKDDSGNITNAAFYDDLLGHIEANGGIVSDPAKLFECDYYSFNPPIDIDKWTNFQKYHWTGLGTAKDLGEFITKDYEGTQVILYSVNDEGGFDKHVVGIHYSGNKPMVNNTVGDLLEDVTSNKRLIYKWSGSAWELVVFTVLDELPATATSLVSGAFVYVARVGLNYQRPVFMHYSNSAGRYVSKVPVISLAEPDAPIDGMIWEDCRTAPERKFLVYSVDQWVELSYDKTNSFTSVVKPSTGYYYDCRLLSDISDDWSSTNWWIHINDLSGTDKTLYSDNKATRPIISFWQSIEAFSNTKPLGPQAVPVRNSSPLFNVYMYDGTAITGELDDFVGNTIFEYDGSQRNIDTVLSRYVSYDTTGELLFTLSLETATYSKDGVALPGYKFFKDTYTGLYHYCWTKAQDTLNFDAETDIVPLNLSNNANHDLTTAISRRVVIEHYRSVIGSLSSGMALGDNTYRWTEKNPVSGAVIMDSEGSLLLNLCTLFDDKFDIPNAIRSMGTEYARFMKRFHKKLNTFWTDGTNVTPTGVLKTLNNTQVLNKLLSQIFVNIDSNRAFYNSKMGTFTHEVYLTTTPIMVPASPARIGAIAAFQPALVTYATGETYILGHDGSLIPSYGDGRDDIILALENKFFAEIPTNRQTETLSASPLLNKNFFSLNRFVGNRSITLTYNAVNELVSDYTAETGMANGYSVYSRTHGKLATYNNGKWTTTVLQIGDKFENLDDGLVYIFNGYGVYSISAHDRDYAFDYSYNNFNSIIRKEFEKWYIDRDLNPATHTFDDSNKFTWNFSSTGQEGYWKGMYRRVYGTDRPHIRPWECLGYSLQPSWWTSVFTANSGKWNSTNAMWADLKTGTLMKAYGVPIEDWQLLPADAPVPVNSTGDLLDPLTAGLLTMDALINKTKEWSYGDGSPVETQFLYSHEGRYALALVSYLMKPARFVEFLWSDYNFSIGDSSTVFGGEVQVSDNSYRRRNVQGIKVHAESKGYSDMGLNSWIAETLILSGNTPKLLANVVKSATVSLGWQVNGFISKDSTVIRTSSGIEVPYEDISIITHKSQPFKTIFYSGVNILKKGGNYQLYGYDYSKPYFSTLSPIVSSIGGATQQREDFTATEKQSTFNLTKFKIAKVNDLSNITVLIDGFKIESFDYTITSSSVTLNDDNITAGQTVSVILDTYISASPYNAKAFKTGTKTYIYYDQPSTTQVDYVHGHEFTSPELVVQFFSDYQNYLASVGFVFDSENWIDVAARFAQWTQKATDGQIFVDVASSTELKLKSEFGFVEDFKINQYGGFNVLNIGSRPVGDFNTYRFGDELTVKSTTPMYGVRIVLRSYQHALFVSNRTKFNDLIYDPFSGLKQKRLLVSTLKTQSWHGRLETPGYLINGDQLVPNLEKTVKDISKLYDTVDTSLDTDKSAQALSLYNFYYKDYMKDMGVSRTLAFDYHKRMIREKGTLRSLAAFSKSKANIQPLEVRECWAWKVGNFGQDKIDYAELNLKDTDFIKKLQTFVFGNTAETDSDVLFKNHTVDSSRWLKKPKGENITFPADLSNVNLLVNILEDQYLKNKLFLFDPVRNFYDPLAMSQVDIKTAYDPAYYTSGEKIYAGYEWDKNQVGTVWWDTTNLEYEDYSNDALSLSQASDIWGKMKNYSITDISISGDEYTITLNKPHNFNAYDIVDIGMSDDLIKFKANIFEIISTTQIKLTLIDQSSDVIASALDSDYLKFKTITRSDVTVYQWIETTISPIDFISENDGVVLKYNDAQSYTTKTYNGVQYYYFWVRGLKLTPKNKTITTDETERRLKDPSGLLLPWFGIVGNNKLIIDTSTIGVKDNLSLEVSIEPLNFERNNQWLLIPEGNNTNLTDKVVIDKIIDSLTLTDSYGNTLPYIANDPYGTLHGQVIFKDATKAKAVFLETINEQFSKIYKSNIGSFSQIFSDTSGWWEYTTYDALGYVPAQYVQTIGEMNSLQGSKEGDVIQVKRARLENSVYYSDVYQYINGVWTLVQADNGSVKFNSDIFAVLRKVLYNILDGIDPSIANDLVFTLLQEMMVQNADCDWMFKTSYIDVRNFVDNTTYSVQPSDESKAIADNVEDVKPYRTKVRDFITVHNIYSDNFEYEEAQTEISDTLETKLTVFADRLSCNLFDDMSYDKEPYDMVPYDLAPWNREELGTADWKTILEFSATNKTKYSAISSSKLLNYRILTYDLNGNQVNTPLYKLTFGVGDFMTVEFDNIPPAVDFVLQASSGIASSSLVNLTTIDENYQNYPSTYEHAAAVSRSYITGTFNDRVVVPSSANTFTGCSDTDQEDGGNSEERIRLNTSDRLSLKVTTYFTQAYEGYDTAPYDITDYDVPSTSLPDAIYRFEYNDTYAGASLTETIPACVTHTVSGGTQSKRIWFSGNDRYIITDVSITRSSVTTVLVEGVDYESRTGQSIKLLRSITSGDIIDLYIGKFILRSKFFTVTNPWTKNYTIQGDRIVYNSKPTKGQSLAISYQEAAINKIIGGESIIADPAYIVQDKVSNVTNIISNLLYDGYTVIDDSDKLVKQYNASLNIFASITRTSSVPYFVEALQESYTYGSGVWTKTFTVGTPVLTLAETSIFGVIT